MLKSFLLLSLFTLTLAPTFSQNTDSLLTALNTAKKEQKVKILMGVDEHDRPVEKDFKVADDGFEA